MSTDAVLVYTGGVLRMYTTARPMQTANDSTNHFHLARHRYIRSWILRASWSSATFWFLLTFGFSFSDILIFVYFLVFLPSLVIFLSFLFSPLSSFLLSLRPFLSSLLFPLSSFLLFLRPFLSPPSRSEYFQPFLLGPGLGLSPHPSPLSFLTIPLLLPSLSRSFLPSLSSLLSLSQPSSPLSFSLFVLFSPRRPGQSIFSHFCWGLAGSSPPHCLPWPPLLPGQSIFSHFCWDLDQASLLIPLLFPFSPSLSFFLLSLRPFLPSLSSLLSLSPPSSPLSFSLFVLFSPPSRLGWFSYFSSLPGF